jgi:hypothetical protein
MAAARPFDRARVLNGLIKACEKEADQALKRLKPWWMILSTGGPQEIRHVKLTSKDIGETGHDQVGGRG